MAMTPDELRNLVLGIRDLEKDDSKKSEYLNKKTVQAGMGQSVKILQEGEAQFRPFFRKTLVALCNIPTGTKITSEMVGAMRPQLHLAGLPSEKYVEVLNKTAKADIAKHQPISSEMII